MTTADKDYANEKVAMKLYGSNEMVVLGGNNEMAETGILKFGW